MKQIINANHWTPRKPRFGHIVTESREGSELSFCRRCAFRRFHGIKSCENLRFLSKLNKTVWMKTISNGILNYCTPGKLRFRHIVTKSRALSSNEAALSSAASTSQFAYLVNTKPWRHSGASIHKAVSRAVSSQRFSPAVTSKSKLVSQPNGPRATGSYRGCCPLFLIDRWSEPTSGTFLVQPPLRLDFLSAGLQAPQYQQAWKIASVLNYCVTCANVIWHFNNLPPRKPRFETSEQKQFSLDNLSRAWTNYGPGAMCGPLILVNLVLRTRLNYINN